MNTKPSLSSGSLRIRVMSWVWAAACLALGMYFLRFGGELGKRSTAPGARAALVARESQPQLPRGVALRNIEDIQIGERVLAENPQLAPDDERGPEVDSETWLKIRLVMHKSRGEHIDIALLRPVQWVDALNALPGATIHLDLEEMGAVGPAEVVELSECPEVAAGRGQVVTGTFAHTSTDVIDLITDDLPEPIGTTSAHRFWSEDRQEFVPAGDLKLGEQLRTWDGQTPRLLGVRPRIQAEMVFNLEVFGEHVYYVSPCGLLVHNSYIEKVSQRSQVNAAGEIEALSVRTNRLEFTPRNQLAGDHVLPKQEITNAIEASGKKGASVTYVREFQDSARNLRGMQSTLNSSKGMRGLQDWLQTPKVQELLASPQTRAGTAAYLSTMARVQRRNALMVDSILGGNFVNSNFKLSNQEIRALLDDAIAALK